MRSFRFSLLVLLASFLFSCAEDPVVPDVYDVPDLIQPYIDDFILEAQARGIDLEITDLRVEFASNLESSAGAAAAGLCHFENNPNRIQLDTTSTNWTFNDQTRELLVFHELGHCVLNRRRHTHKRLPNGNWASMMRASGEQLYGMTFNNFKREYFLDELFDSTTVAPDWADAYGYNDIAPSQKTEIFVDEFSDNRNNWNLIGTAQSQRSIQNGYYEFKSLISGASFAARTINFDSSKDFEIETSLEVVSGEAPAMLMWGASGSENPYFHGFTPDSIGLYGNLQNGISLSRLDETITADGFNILTVRKIGSEYFFFLNEQPFDNGRFEDFFGNVHGFYVGGNATIRSDYLRIYEIIP